jgi:hypothetical protein
MANLDPQLERDAVDLITNCMYSVGFLHDISDAIFSGNRDSLTVGKFYDGWFNATGRAQPVALQPWDRAGAHVCGNPVRQGELVRLDPGC